MRFVVDSMLGKLAKWLRVLGFDACYQKYYTSEMLGILVGEDRMLLTRSKTTAKLFDSALFIESDRVGDQLKEVNKKMALFINKDVLFSRCILCNELLENPKIEMAEENIPDYVLYKHSRGYKVCPLCNRYYWPGSHRERMVRQLQAWDLLP
ncbi:Mut7-C RNAse domain-containing protein [Thermodesulfobacteriota bacterium]